MNDQGIQNNKNKLDVFMGSTPGNRCKSKLNNDVAKDRIGVTSHKLCAEGCLGGGGGERAFALTNSNIFIKMLDTNYITHKKTENHMNFARNT